VSDEVERRDERIFAAGVIAATLLALVLRAYHLAIPMRYDEAVTFLSYASGDFVHAVTAYPTPNNHILHTLLVRLSVDVFEPYPFFIRAPTFIAGCLLVPATAWMAARLWDRRVGVLTAFLVAAAPVLVEYSTNARGYSLVALATVAAVAVGARLLDEPSAAGWLALAGLGVLGLYSVPVMLLPWAGITVWLFVNLFIGDGSLLQRLRRELPLAAVTALVTALVVALYLPVVRANGLEALTGNRFVATMGWSEFSVSVAPALAATAGHWMRGVPWPFAVLAMVGVAASVATPGRNEDRFPLAWSLLLGVTAVMLFKRNPGEARIWLWALPLVLAYVAAGWSALLHRWVHPARAPAFIAGAGLVAATALSLYLVADRRLWRSLETGGFMEVEEVAAWLAPRVLPSDVLVTDFVSREPLAYYLSLHGIETASLAGEPGERGRAWVVVNRNEVDRAERAVMRAAALGISLETARPVARYGRVDIFGFGQGDAATARPTPDTDAGEPLPSDTLAAEGIATSLPGTLRRAQVGRLRTLPANHPTRGTTP
jgi:4-amino-4-deoxy-L-arabinose transferase-like glycosyltransferase